MVSLHGSVSAANFIWTLACEVATARTRAQRGACVQQSTDDVCVAERGRDMQRCGAILRSPSAYELGHATICGLGVPGAHGIHGSLDNVRPAVKGRLEDALALQHVFCSHDQV